MFIIFYVILAHQDPKLLSRIIHLLDSENVRFYIHLDKKTDFKEFIKGGDFNNERINWVHPRIKIKWGHISMVEATLQAFRSIPIIKENDRIVLLSGQDFPIKSKKYINDFFTKNCESDFIEGSKFPVSDWGSASFSRIEDYHVFTKKRGWVYSIPYIHDYQKWRSLPFSKKKWAIFYFYKVFRRRIFPLNVIPHGGSQWFSIKGSTLVFILKFLDDNPEYLRFHKDTLIPDEIFFQSIVWSNSQLFFENRIIDSNHHYIDWNARNGMPPPVILDESDFEKVIHSDKLFCRKVDSIISNRLLKKLETNIRS